MADRTSRCFGRAALCWAALALCPAAEAAAPRAAPGKRRPGEVAALIDREVLAKRAEAKAAAGPLADDAEFLRRACLDLTGRIPTAGRVTTFLASKSESKRADLIDELLASPEHPQHFARLWARLIAAEEPPQRPALEKWLAERFAAGDGWDRTVSAMLTATGKTPQTAFVLSNVENKVPQPNKLAGSAARLFLGVRLQCAECHRHPFASWEQDEFWGMAAFFAKTRVQAKGDPVGVAEAAVPAKGKAKAEGPAIVVPATAGKGAGRVVKAKFLGGERPALRDDEPFRPALAAWLTAKDNPYFAKAAVNRAWGQLFGRGLVEPVDDMHDGNAPSHPALLQALAVEFAASGFDAKHLLRCVCNSKAYQRTSRGDADEETYGRMAVKVMTPDALYDSLCVAMGVRELKVADVAPPGSGRGGARPAGKGPARERFVKAFETGDPETTPVEFTHGIPQALSLLNEPATNHGAPVIDALVKGSKGSDEVIEGLFLAALSRRPTEAERARTSAHVKSRPSAAKGYADVLWVLINSPEFALVP